VDAAPPNTNLSYTTPTSLLDYGNKPNILYDAVTNTLLVTMEKGDHRGSVQYGTSSEFLDTSNNVIRDNESTEWVIYRHKDFPLQKWNHLLVNYNGGTLDIFINGELVKSMKEVIPYMTLDTLTVGAKKGIQGGVGELLYFTRPITASNLHYLYHSSKYSPKSVF
jgi:hypothetical protein